MARMNKPFLFKTSEHYPSFGLMSTTFCLVRERRNKHDIPLRKLSIVRSYHVRHGKVLYFVAVEIQQGCTDLYSGGLLRQTGGPTFDDDHFTRLAVIFTPSRFDDYSSGFRHNGVRCQVRV